MEEEEEKRVHAWGDDITSVATYETDLRVGRIAGVYDNVCSVVYWCRAMPYANAVYVSLSLTTRGIYTRARLSSVCCAIRNSDST